ncbi:MAG: metallophosphoesterase family protein, partial [Saprospiraceae bacterium]|nr:metallophosphoesterase family protein [Saprospiraceae bacterium]
MKTLHPGLLPALENAHLDHVLHAGDVSTWRVIELLREIAPVDVARGNRDLSLPREIGWVKHIQLAGVPVALMHGHGNWFRYFFDKIFYLSQGYRLERY